MKISETMVRKITITEVDDIDPIHVTIEDMGAGKGRVSVTCASVSASAYWNAMGGTVNEFFNWVNTDYLMGCFFPGIHHQVNDYDELVHICKKHIIDERRGGALCITKHQARELWDKVGEIDTSDDQSIDGLHRFHSEILNELIGDEWYLDIPDMDNPEYTYREKILAVVQKALSNTNTSEQS